MNNEQFMESIQGDTLVPNLIETVEVDNMAIGLYLEQMPNVDTLKQVKHLLETTETVSTADRMVLPVYFTVDAGVTVQQIGMMHLTMERHLRLERLLNRYGLDLCYVIDGIKGATIPRETLINTIKLSYKSIYDHI